MGKKYVHLSLNIFKIFTLKTLFFLIPAKDYFFYYPTLPAS